MPPCSISYLPPSPYATPLQCTSIEEPNRKKTTHLADPSPRREPINKLWRHRNRDPRPDRQQRRLVDRISRRNLGPQRIAPKPIRLPVLLVLLLRHPSLLVPFRLLLLLRLDPLILSFQRVRAFVAVSQDAVLSHRAVPVRLDPLQTRSVDGEEAEREIDGGEKGVHARCVPAVFFGEGAEFCIGALGLRLGGRVDDDDDDEEEPEPELEEEEWASWARIRGEECNKRGMAARGCIMAELGGNADARGADRAKTGWAAVVRPREASCRRAKLSDMALMVVVCMVRVMSGRGSLVEFVYAGC